MDTAPCTRCMTRRIAGRSTKSYVYSGLLYERNIELDTRKGDRMYICSFSFVLIGIFKSLLVCSCVTAPNR